MQFYELSAVKGNRQTRPLSKSASKSYHWQLTAVCNQGEVILKPILHLYLII